MQKFPDKHRIQVAKHEAGHALVDLSLAQKYDVQIASWEIGRFIKGITKKDFMRCRNYSKVINVSEDTGGCVSAYAENVPPRLNLILCLAGDAASNSNTFARPCEKDFAESDYDYAQNIIQKQWRNNMCFPGEIHGAIQECYKKVRTLFLNPDIQYAVASLSEYMLYEIFRIRGNVHQDLMDVLRYDGITKIQLQRFLKIFEQIKIRSIAMQYLRSAKAA